MLFTEKRLVTPYLEIAGNITTFLNILFVELSKFSSGLSDFFPLPNTWSFCRLTGTSRVKSFSSCQTFFRSFGCYFQIIWELVRVSLLFWIPSLIFGFFMCLNCLRTFFTIMKTSNSCLFDNFCLRWVCMRSLFLLANQRFYQFHVFFWRNNPRLPWAMSSIHWTSLSEFFQYLLNRGKIQFFGWKVLPNFVSWPAFFFIIILNYFLIFIWKSHSFLLKTHTLSVSFWSVDESVTVKFVMEGCVTKNTMQCYATDNLVKEDFTLHRSSTERLQRVWKINF